MSGYVNYEELADSVWELIRDVPYEVANLANVAALLWEKLPDINWVGFYKMTDGKLVLGPFQGKIACVWIL